MTIGLFTNDWDQPYNEDVLDGAIQLIETRGWCRDSYHDKQGRFCFLGALAAAQDEALRGLPWNDDDGDPVANTDDVWSAGIRALNLGPLANPIVEWNDRPHRTKEDVLQRLHEMKDSGSLDIDWRS